MLKGRTLRNCTAKDKSHCSRMGFRDTSRYWKFKHYYSVILKIKIEFGIVVQEPNVLAYMISVMNTCDLVGNDFQLRWRREAEGFIYFFGF